MAKQTFTTGQVLTAAQMTSLQETAMGGGPATAKTASYVLVAADAGKTVAMNAAGATTITVNTGLFAAGDTLFINNLNTGVLTITAGTATVSTSASLALAQHEGGTLFFTSAGVSTFFKAAGAAPAGGITYADYTPTLVNFTKGNGTFNFRYAESGKVVFLDINITFGSTTTIGQATISLPVAPKYLNARVAANYLDAGTAFFSASATIENNGGVNLLSLKAQKSDATYTTLVAVDTAVPFTWTTNDQINIQCVYEAA